MKEADLEEMWAASERREKERRKRENAAAWYAFHAHMHELHARLSAEHEAKALALLEEPPGPQTPCGGNDLMDDDPTR